jgi:hypothetical protein
MAFGSVADLADNLVSLIDRLTSPSTDRQQHREVADASLQSNYRNEEGPMTWTRASSLPTARLHGCGIGI